MDYQISVHHIDLLDSEFAAVEICCAPDTPIYEHSEKLEAEVKAHLRNIGFEPAELTIDWEVAEHLGQAFQTWLVKGN